MKVIQKACLGILFFAAFAQGQAPTGAPTYEDDDWMWGLCYYDSECTFSCGDALYPQDCLNYTYKNADAIAFDVPFFKGSDGKCVSTSEDPSEEPKKVGVCCDSCDPKDRGTCTTQYVNPDLCAQQDKYYFVDAMEELRLERADLSTESACFEARLAPPRDEPTSRLGSGSGDPHFKTWTGEKFDYHGECDLVLIDNPTFHNGQGLKVHIRTTRVSYFSFIEKIAVQIGDDVLEFANDAQNFSINNAPAEPVKKHVKTYLGGFIVRRDAKAISIRLSDAKDGSYHSHNVAKIDLKARTNGFPAVVVDAGDGDVFKGSLGLLGDWATGSKMGRNGETVFVVDPKNAANYALEWQVRDTEPMLFQEARFPQFPAKCTPPKKMMGSRLGMSHMEKEAEKACAHFDGDKEDCLFDVMATRSIKAASSE